MNDTKRLEVVFLVE